MSDYPENEKMASVRDESQTIGGFLEWLLGERQLVLCEPREGRIDNFYMPVRYTIQDLLAEYFEIDLDKVDQERRQMLETLREYNMGVKNG